jgi:hypothetical protein
VNDDDAKKEDAISTSATATPPVQEIRYQSNQYVNSTSSSATPTMSVMGYAPPPAFTAPIESGGTIYQTGVRYLNLHYKYERSNESGNFKTFLLFYTFSLFFLKYLKNSEAGWHIICLITTCDVLICYVHGM